MSAPFPIRLIPLLPLAGALINLALGRRCGKFFTSFVGCLSVAGAMVLAWHGSLILWHSADWAVLRDTLFSGDWIASSELDGKNAIHILRLSIFFIDCPGIFHLIYRRKIVPEIEILTKGIVCQE